MDPTLYHEYNAVRDVILKEHELSPRSYLEFFNSLSRSSGETYVMYCARLRALLNMYVESRKVRDFDTLVSLIVCDRIKSVLSEGCLRHVLSVETAAADGWLRADKLAETVDLYTANHFANDRPRASAIVISRAGSDTLDCTATAGRPQNQPPPPGLPQQAQLTQRSKESAFNRHSASGGSRPSMVSSTLNASNANIICYKCKGTGHTRKVCPSQTTSRRVNACGRPNQERGQQTINATASSAEKTVTTATDTHSSVTILECMIVNHIMGDNRGLVNVKNSVDSVRSDGENVEMQPSRLDGSGIREPTTRKHRREVCRI